MATNIENLLARLKKPQRGHEFSKAFTYDWISAIPEMFEALLRGDNLKEGQNIRLKTSALWTLINATSGSDSGAGGASNKCPLDFNISTVSGSITANVTPGSANNLLPSNIYNTFTIDSTTVWQCKIRALSDGQSITSCSLVVDDQLAAIQAPTPFGLPESVDVLVGVIVAAQWYRVIGCGSILLSGSQQFVTSPLAATPNPPGTLNYTPYYCWAISTI